MPSRPEDRHLLAVPGAAVEVDLGAGARAVSWTVEGMELLGRYGDDPVQHGMYPMAPWAGRIRGNVVQWSGQAHALPVTHDTWALHGTALAQRARVIDAAAGPQSARVVARIDDRPGWPWPMAVDIGWELSPGVLAATITVHALEESFPVVVGWHPWFRRSLGVGAPLAWHLPATSRLVRGSDHLPTGERVPFSPADGPFDDAFAVPDGTATVTWPGALALDVASDGGWYVVFDELAGFVCLEPQSGPPDGLRAEGDPGVAAPGSPHVLRTEWRWRALPA